MTPSQSLSGAEIEALEATLDDEYKSYETYAQVIDDFGEIRPFINIVAAEQRHYTALLRLFDRYGIIPPANRWDGNAPRYDSVHDACVAAVAGEIENGALYERALASTRRDDIRTVYRALQSASLERHLPAFERCTQRATRGYQ